MESKKNMIEKDSGMDLPTILISITRHKDLLNSHNIPYFDRGTPNSLNDAKLYLADLEANLVKGIRSKSSLTNYSSDFTGGDLS